MVCHMRLIRAAAVVGAALAAGCGSSTRVADLQFTEAWSGDLAKGATISGLAALPDGGFVVAGEPNAFDQNLEAYVIGLGPDGAQRWRIDGTFSGNSIGLGSDRAGRVYLSGALTKEATLGSTKLTAAAYPTSFVLALDAAGAVQWAKVYDTKGSSSAELVVADPSGVFVSGRYYGGLTVDGQTAKTSSANAGLYLLGLGADGSVKTLKSFTSSAYVTGTGMSLSADGDVFITGTFSGVVNFGDLPRASGNGQAIFLARFAHDGSLRWSRHFFGQSGLGAEFLGDGIALFGYSYATDLGAGEMLRGNFVADLDGSGAYRWSHSDSSFYGGTRAGAVTSTGHLVLFHEHRDPPQPGDYTAQPLTIDLRAIDGDGNSVASWTPPALAPQTYVINARLATARDGTVLLGVTREASSPNMPNISTTLRALRLVPLD